MAIRMSGLASGMDTESIIAELMSAQRLKSTKIENKITKLEWKQDIWKDMNKKIYSFYTGPLSKLKMQGSFNTKKVSSSNEAKATVTANSSAPGGTHALKINQLASSQFVTGSQLSTDDNGLAISTATKLVDLGMTADASNTVTVKVGTTEKSITITDATTVADFTSTLKSAGLTASYDTTQKRFFISSAESGLTNGFSITEGGTADIAGLGLSAIQDDGNGNMSLVSDGVDINGDPTYKSTMVKAADSKITYNGAELTSSSNTIIANGLTIDLKGVTDTNETISLNITDDTQAVYDMVKDFVKQYNDILTKMNDTYYADTAKGYDPLTDDEKTTMSDTEIETWETKIKDSLLRRDDSLGTLLSDMKSKVGGSTNVSGTNYSLASFGIGSTNYTEKGILHINGDVDEDAASSKDNALLTALTTNPEAVMKTLNDIGNNLYASITKTMTSSSLRSALKVYNDKEITKTITNYKDDLNEEEDRLTKIEDRYYSQFSAMETALAKINSQSSSLASMLGTG